MTAGRAAAEELLLDDRRVLWQQQVLVGCQQVAVPPERLGYAELLCCVWLIEPQRCIEAARLSARPCAVHPTAGCPGARACRQEHRNLLKHVCNSLTT